MPDTEIVPGDPKESAPPATGPTLEEALRAIPPDLKLVPAGQEEEAGEPRHHSARQPRRATGEFDGPPADEVEHEEPRADAELELDEPEPTEVEEPEPTEVEEPEPFVLRAPPDEEGADPIEIVLDADDDARRALAKLQAASDRVLTLDRDRAQIELLRAKVEAQSDELAEIEQEIAVDPAGFIEQNIPAQRKIDVAVALAMDDEVYEALEKKFYEWGRDPRERRLAAAEARAARLESRSTVQQELDVRRQKLQLARRIQTTVDDLAATVPPDRAPMFLRDATADIVAHLQTLNGTPFDPDTIPDLLKSRLELYGVQPPRKRAAQPVAPAAHAPTDTGQKLRESRERRRAASVTAPASTGHVPSLRKPPRDAGLEETFKWAKQNLRGL